MIYIPRFKRRKRLDTRGGMGSNMPAEMPGSAVKKQAAATVLSTIADKIAPTLTKLFTEEKEEEEKTFINNSLKKINNGYAGIPADSSLSQFGETVTPIYEEIKESDIYKDSQKVRDAIDLHYAGKEQLFGAKVANYTFSKTVKAKRENLYEELIRGLEETSINDIAKINVITENAIEQQLDNFVYEEGHRNGPDWKLNNETHARLQERPDIKFRSDLLENKIKSLVRKKAIKHLKISDFEEAPTLDKQLDEVTKWHDNDLDTPRSRSFKFLPLIDAYEIGRDEFKAEAFDALQKRSRAKRAQDNSDLEQLRKDNEIKISDLRNEANSLTLQGNDAKLAGQYNKIKQTLWDRYKLYIPTFDHATKLEVKTAKMEKSYHLMHEILKKMDEDPSYFHGDYAYKREQLKKLDFTGVLDWGLSGVPDLYIGEALTYIKLGDKKNIKTLQGDIKQTLNNFKAVHQTLKHDIKRNILGTPQFQKSAQGLLPVTEPSKKLEGLMSKIIINFQANMKNLIVEVGQSKSENVLDKKHPDYAGDKAKNIYIDNVFIPLKTFVVDSLTEAFPGEMNRPDGPLREAVENLNNIFYYDTPRLSPGQVALPSNAELVRSLKSSIKNIRESLNKTGKLTEEKEKSIKAVLVALPLISRVPKNTEDLKTLTQSARDNKKDNTNVGMFEK
jgi:hypothetical protein